MIEIRMAPPIAPANIPTNFIGGNDVAPFGDDVSPFGDDVGPSGGGGTWAGGKEVGAGDGACFGVSGSLERGLFLSSLLRTMTSFWAMLLAKIKGKL